MTGADGFIGSHLVEALVARGDEVRAVVYYNAFNSWGWLDRLPENVKDRIEVAPGDVRDAGWMRTATEGCETVYHLAALIGIPYSYHAPHSYIETNVVGTLNVLEAARAAGVRRVVCTSTSEVYGSARAVPITEAHALNAQSPYAASKASADMLALSFHAAFGMPVTILRPFNTYGPRQSTRAVIPTIISQIASGARRVKLGALAPTRDFSFVTDTATGFIQAAACDAAIGQVMNVGSGFEISVGDTARLIAEEMEAEIDILSEAERVRPKTSEVERLFAGTAKARELIGWSPEYGGLEGFRRGLRRTIEWFTKAENLACYRPGEYTI